ncbi:hypothetical protein [Streptomyces sp. NPDC014744]|uniref:hypothetical protein n=1 Tax=Streptomyces sp. NPDC014744 TaxID=3364903 RepID=UPI00370340F7
MSAAFQVPSAPSRRTALRGIGAGAFAPAGPVKRIATAIIPSPSVNDAVDGSYDRIVGISESTLQAPSRAPCSSCSACSAGPAPRPRRTGPDHLAPSRSAPAHRT